MPVSKHYKGKGKQVMADMVKRYGAKRGKAIFYATENKQKMRTKARKKFLQG